MSSQQFSRDEISVIIPAYNTEKYITETLDSVKNQTLIPHELIVVNDGATDSTPHLINAWEQKNNHSINIRIIDKTNGGVSSARNAGIKQCKTPLFALLDADDKYHPEFIETAIKAFNTATDLTVFFGNQKLVDGNGNQISKWLETKRITALKSKSIDDELLLLQEPILPSLVDGSYISCSASVFQKAKLSSNGLYDEQFKAAEDTEFLIRNLDNSKVAFTYKELAMVVRRSGSITQSQHSLVELGRALAIDKHRDTFVKLGVNVDEVLKKQLGNCYYQESMKGYSALKELDDYAKKNISTKKNIGVKNILRSILKDIRIL